MNPLQTELLVRDRITDLARAAKPAPAQGAKTPQPAPRRALRLLTAGHRRGRLAAAWSAFTG